MSAAIIYITCFNCRLRRNGKEKNNFVDRRESNHIKRKIDVPLELEMDDDDGDDEIPGRLSS
jgi:hypothetical protein